MEAPIRAELEFTITSGDRKPVLFMRPVLAIRTRRRGGRGGAGAKRERVRGSRGVPGHGRRSRGGQSRPGAKFEHVLFYRTSKVRPEREPSLRFVPRDVDSGRIGVLTHE